MNTYKIIGVEWKSGGTGTVGVVAKKYESR